MNSRNLLFAVIIMFILHPSCIRDQKSRYDRKEIEAAVTEHLQAYPLSTLKDIYKSFFQDEFGPGHLIQDTASALEYLLREVKEMKSQGRYFAEPCGLGKHFVRVPLDVVKDSIFDVATFFKAFIESSRSFSTPGITQWKKDWAGILEVVEMMNPDLPDLEQDKKDIDEMLENEETVMHHSDVYIQNYDPHYRLMTMEQWTALLDALHQ